MQSEERSAVSAASPPVAVRGYCIAAGRDDLLKKMQEILIVLSHADNGNPKCRGGLMPIDRGDRTDLVCGECGATVGTAAVDEFERSFLRMAMSAGISDETRPYSRHYKH